MFKRNAIIYEPRHAPIFMRHAMLLLTFRDEMDHKGYPVGWAIFHLCRQVSRRFILLNKISLQRRGERGEGGRRRIFVNNEFRFNANNYLRESHEHLQRRMEARGRGRKGGEARESFRYLKYYASDRQQQIKI